MKPDCQQVLTQFASFSVEELSDSQAASLLHHIEECEPCKGQWLLFEKTLMVTTQSGPRDEDVEQHRSQQMWLVCLEHARKRVEPQHAQQHELESSQPQHEVEHSPVKSAKKARGQAPQSLETGAHNSSSSGESAASDSVLVAPRTGLMLVGGALLLLASAHWFSPRPPAPVSAQLPPMPAQLQTVGFQPLPARAATLVDYGATFGFDAFSDHVTPTLISASPRLVPALTPSIASPKTR